MDDQRHPIEHQRSGGQKRRWHGDEDREVTTVARAMIRVEAKS
jgi:hypothetical protein